MVRIFFPCQSSGRLFVGPLSMKKLRQPWLPDRPTRRTVFRASRRVVAERLVELVVFHDLVDHPVVLQEIGNVEGLDRAEQVGDAAAGRERQLETAELYLLHVLTEVAELAGRIGLHVEAAARHTLHVPFHDIDTNMHRGWCCWPHGRP